MKFRFKIALSMICLVSLLFGIGGSALVSISFQTTLTREKESAYHAYQMILNSLEIAATLDSDSPYEYVADILEQLFAQNSTSWSAVQLVAGDDVLYSSGSADDFRLMTEPLSTDQCLVSHFTDSGHRQCLQLSSALDLNGKSLRLDAVYDISPVYQTRSQQQDAYQKVFLIMVAACAILAYSISWYLTRPLSKLARASREIAAGNLSSRAGIRTNDEIGVLAGDFDDMADQLEQNIFELIDSVERQERFMGSFAHELKTPLTAIIGYADLLRSKALSHEEQNDAANYIFTEGKRLERLSLKLLDILVAGNQEIELARISPATVIHYLVTHLTPVYEEGGICFQTSCEEGTCLLDLALVKSLLLNLFDNARKALGTGGTITVTSQMTPDGCEIRIQDDGCGIPAESLNHLTEAFYRVDKSRSRAQGGVGLGLTLCAKIVELHHGNLRIESNPQQGTCVIINIRGGRS